MILYDKIHISFNEKGQKSVFSPYFAGKQLADLEKTFQYDAKGNQVSIKSNIGEETKVYDAQNRLVKQTKASPSGSGDIKTFFYDKNDNVVKIENLKLSEELHHTNFMTYTYDAAGTRILGTVERIEVEPKYIDGEAKYEFKRLEFEYNAEGLQTKEFQLNDKKEREYVVNFKYDEAGHLLEKRMLKITGELVNKVEHTYTTSGALASTTKYGPHNSWTSTTKFSYNEHGHLIEENLQGDGYYLNTRIDIEYYP